MTKQEMTVWGTREAAAHLRVSVGMIRMACAGKGYSGIVLRHIRVGRAIRTCQAWVDAWMMAHVIR